MSPVTVDGEHKKKDNKDDDLRLSQGHEMQTEAPQMSKKMDETEWKGNKRKYLSEKGRGSDKGKGRNARGRKGKRGDVGENEEETE